MLSLNTLYLIMVGDLTKEQLISLRNDFFKLLDYSKKIEDNLSELTLLNEKLKEIDDEV